MQVILHGPSKLDVVQLARELAAECICHMVTKRISAWRTEIHPKSKIRKSVWASNPQFQLECGDKIVFRLKLPLTNGRVFGRTTICVSIPSRRQVVVDEDAEVRAEREEQAEKLTKKQEKSARSRTFFCDFDEKIMCEKRSTCTCDNGSNVTKR